MMFLRAHGFRTIAHDRCGNGGPDQSGSSNDLDTWAEDLAGLIEHVDLYQLVLVGHSTEGGRLVGLRKAQEIILTNRRVKAPEAGTIGMVTRTVEDEALVTEGHAVAQTLAASAMNAIGVARRLLRESFFTSFETQLEREVCGIASAGTGAEGREGLAAYLAKRLLISKESKPWQKPISSKRCALPAAVRARAGWSTFIPPISAPLSSMR